MKMSADNGISVPQLPVVQQSTTPRPSRSQQYMKWIGASMIAVGLMSVIISSVMVALNYVLDTDYAGSGIWCGLFFIATGGCAVNAVSNRNTDTTIATLVMAIASLLLAATMIGVIATALSTHSAYVFYGGFKAAEGLLIVLGLSEIALCGCCIAVSVAHLRQCGQQNDLPLPRTGMSDLERSVHRSSGSGSGDNGASSSTAQGDASANGSPNGPSPFATWQHLTTAKWIGLWQIAVGLASILISSVIVSQTYGDTGVGIWCGVIFTVTGALTFYATSARSKGVIIASVVMSILSSVLLWSMIIGSSLLLRRNFWCYIGIFCKMRSELAVANGLLVVLSVGELIMSVWCTIVCCIAICRPGFVSCCSCCIPKVLNYRAEGDTVQAHAPATGNVQTRNATTGAADSTS